MNLENNRATLLYYIKLCASFQIHGWSETWVTIWKCSIRVKIGDFLSSVTLKFDEWLWKTLGHLFYTTLSFVHHSKAMGEVKLELESGNAQFGSKSATFCPVWPWYLTDDLENEKGTSPMLLQALCIISNHFYMWIQTGVTVRKRLSRVMTSVTLTFYLWPWPFAWTSHLSLVIIPENFRMMRWWEHSEKNSHLRMADPAAA